MIRFIEDSRILRALLPEPSLAYPTLTALRATPGSKKPCSWPPSPPCATPPPKTFYDRKRAEGKRHNAALICRARRRCDVILAMLRTRKPYQPARTAQPARIANAA